MLLAKRLDNLYLNLNSCQECVLAQNRISVVPGRGNYASKIVLIGEAPGIQESTWRDRNGKPFPSPFVGKAGENLTLFLSKASLSRSEIFITNTVKCRPTKGNLGKANRPPAQKRLTPAHSGWILS